MKKVTIALFALCLAFLAAPAMTQPNTKIPDLEGIYHMSGEMDGIKYSGSCTISQEEGSRMVRITSTVRGQTTTSGFGIISEDAKSVSFVWTQKVPKTDAVGLSVFKISGKKLVGGWVMHSATDLVPETLTFIRKIEDPET